MTRRELKTLMKTIDREMKRLRPLLPEIDPHDMHLILLQKMRPVGSRRFFIRAHGDGFVF